MRVRHQLKPIDFDRRIRFSKWLIEKCRDRRFLANLIIGDEVGFAMNGKVNSQNVREYAPHGERPEINYAVNESRERCTVWVGLCGNGTLLGPFFFDGYVNAANYLRMLNGNCSRSLQISLETSLIMTTFLDCGGHKMEPLPIVPMKSENG